MRPRHCLAALLAAAVLGALSAADAMAAAPAEAAAADAEVLAIAARVADWQLGHLDSFDYVPAAAFRRDTTAPRDWVQAAFYIGLARFADVSGQPRHADAVLAHGRAEGWGFDARPRHADSDATGAACSPRTSGPAGSRSGNPPIRRRAPWASP